MSDPKPGGRTGESVLNRILGWLDEKSVVYHLLHHEPTRTSEESARVRGEDLSIGAKAIVLKLDGGFCLFVLSAARRLNSKAVRSHLAVKKTRFASTEELQKVTGLLPGSVPPFGRPILDLDLFVDPSVIENDRLAFNAGSLTDSVIMLSSDYQRIAKPNIFAFSME